MRLAQSTFISTPLRGAQHHTGRAMYLATRLIRLALILMPIVGAHLSSSAFAATFFRMDCSRGPPTIHRAAPIDAGSRGGGEGGCRFRGLRARSGGFQTLDRPLVLKSTPLGPPLAMMLALILFYSLAPYLLPVLRQADIGPVSEAQRDGRPSNRDSAVTVVAQRVRCLGENTPKSVAGRVEWARAPWRG